MTQPLIGVGVPTWRGAAFIGETLRSVLSQRGVQLRLIVSVDGSDPDIEQACRLLTSDPRVSVVTPGSRLGWVKNTATVIRAALEEGAEFVCVQPHDDWIEPDYLSKLLDTARIRPQAAVLFSDIKTFGNRKQKILFQDSVTGTPMERQLLLLTRHFNAIAYRGLMRASALRNVPPISGNDCSDFACDTVWMARLARAGDLVRVPGALYHKRYHGNNTHQQWGAWHPEQKIAAWVAHCIDMLAEALTAARNDEDRSLLIEAARCRLVQGYEVKLGPYASDIRALPATYRRQMEDAFAAGVASRCDMGSPD